MERCHVNIQSLPDFSKCRILVVGDVMLDRYWFGNTDRISPEAPVPIVHIQQSEHRMGGAANVALNMKTLGAQVHLIGIIGNDEEGRQLSSLLENKQIQADLIVSPQTKTITKLRILSRHQQLMRLDFENPPQASSAFETKEKIKEKLLAHLPHVDLVVFSDYNKGCLQAIPEFIQCAKQAGKLVLIDPKGNDFSRYRHADLITPNLKEFSAIAGQPKDESDLEIKAKCLQNEFQIQHLLITRGEAGMSLLEANHSIVHLPALTHDVYDVTGAGDTVIATLATALAAGCPLKTSVYLSNLAASIAVTQLGAASVDSFELQQALTQTQHLASVTNLSRLLKQVEEAKKHGKKIVFTNGCFDILHAGHVHYLQMAKNLGDYLIVAINDDLSVKKIKGKDRPINALAERLQVLSGLSSVDALIAFSEDTPESLLSKIQPHILVKGGDYTIEEVVGNQLVKNYGGEVKVIPMQMNTSTTKIANRIRETTPKEGN